MRYQQKKNTIQTIKHDGIKTIKHDEQVIVQSGNWNNTMGENDTNDVVIVCKWETQTWSYSKGVPTTNKRFPTEAQHNTKHTAKTNSKQPLLYVITYQTTKTKIKTQTTNNQKRRTSHRGKWKFKQYYRKNNGTNDVAVVWNMNIQTPDWQ